MDKLNNKVIGLALATTSVVLYVICALLYWIIPETLVNYANYLFHGIDITLITNKSMTLGSTVIGLILIFVSSYLIGTLFASLYNYFIKKY